MTRWAEAFRHGTLWTRDRIHGYSLVLLTSELVIFVFCVAGTHGWIVPLDQPNASDFVSYYAAGLLANDGTPALAYDHAAHYAREQQATAVGIGYNFFYYPPIFLFVCAVLARLPYLAVFCVLQATGLLSCLAVVRRIVGSVPLSTLLAFPAVFWAVGTGQNALLTATLLGAAMLTVDHRPVLSGILMGALCYKPHLGLLLPVALAAGRHWRAFAAATLSGLTLIIASGLAFGWTTWSAFLAATKTVGSVYGVADTQIDVTGLTNPYGFILALHGDPLVAIETQIVVTLFVVAVVVWVWAARQRLAIRAAVLLAGIPVAAPIVMFYDLMLSGLAIAWLVHDGRESGFPTWQKTGLVVVFVAPLLSGNIDPTLQMFSAPFAAILVLVLALRPAMARRASIDAALAP